MRPIAWPTPQEKNIRQLVDASFACRYHDLATMLGHSCAAVALVEETQAELPADLAVAAWTQHGNALRLTGRYEEAERMLARAGALSISDVPTRVHLLGVTSSLLRNTGRYEGAARVLRAALAAQRSVGSPEDKARLYIMLGLVDLDAGNRSQAIQGFRAALDLLTPDSPLDLLVSAGHNLFEALIAAGRLTAALAAVAALEPVYRRLDGVRITAKADWMRARLYRAMDRLPAARRAYDSAYRLLSTEPLSPDLDQLAAEIEGVDRAEVPLSPGRV